MEGKKGRHASLLIISYLILHKKQKTGKTLTAPTRCKTASDDLNISDSEENPMAPSQLKGHKQKVAVVLQKFSEKYPTNNHLLGQHSKEFC
jgi:hypothetical protein